MRIVCWQTILTKDHTLFLSKIRKDVAKIVVIGTLRVKHYDCQWCADYNGGGLYLAILEYAEYARTAI